MNTRTAVLDVVYQALNSLNDELADGDKVKVDESLKLFGPDATLDSLALVSVIVDVESAISDKFHLPISLTDDRAVSREISPFADVQSLVAYILELLAEANVSA